MSTGKLADAYEALQSCNVQDAFRAASAAVEREQGALKRINPSSPLLALVSITGPENMDFNRLRDEMFKRKPVLRATAEMGPKTVYWLLGHYVEALIEERGSCI